MIVQACGSVWSPSWCNVWEREREAAPFYNIPLVLFSAIQAALMATFVVSSFSLSLSPLSLCFNLLCRRCWSTDIDRGVASRNLCLERRVRWEIRLCWFFLFWLQHFPWEILRTQTASWLKFLIPRLGLIGYSVGWRRKSDRRCVYGCSSRPMNTKRVGKEEKREKKILFLPARDGWPWQCRGGERKLLQILPTAAAGFRPVRFCVGYGLAGVVVGGGQSPPGHPTGLKQTLLEGLSSNLTDWR